jgi:hypothetical protein
MRRRRLAWGGLVHARSSMCAWRARSSGAGSRAIDPRSPPPLAIAEMTRPRAALARRRSRRRLPTCRPRRIRAPPSAAITRRCRSLAPRTATSFVRIPGFEEWTIGPNGLITESRGHFDQTEYDRQLSTTDSFARAPPPLSAGSVTYASAQGSFPGTLARREFFRHQGGINVPRDRWRLYRCHRRHCCGGHCRVDRVYVRRPSRWPKTPSVAVDAIS